ncbi:MAG TPA: MFS transporter [Solirubrobacteraceae bacterium]|nr:MFS transporter [Solirubrobacteraceae bacterium]
MARPGRASGTARRSLGRDFGWLWTAYAASAYGTGLGFGAFAIIAIRVLHAGPAQVSILSASGLAVGAVVAVPLGPWVEFRRKQPVMVAMDLIRFAALLSIPVAYAMGWLSFLQLIVVSVIAGAAKNAFRAASGAYLKALVEPEDLLVANARFESTTWSSTAIGPPLGGAAIGLFGPVITVVADAVSYLLSALGIAAIRHTEPAVAKTGPRRARGGDLLDGWRYILVHPQLRALFVNTIVVNGLILATEPLLSVLMLARLGFAPWQFGLALASPCVGGLIGARLARRLVARHGQAKLMFVFGALRACWPVGLVLIGPGIAGIAIVIVLQLGLITSIGVFSPVMATYRLEQTPPDRVARVLSAWSVSSSATVAALTALFGLVAAVTSPRAGIGIAGALLLLTPLLLPRAGTRGINAVSSQGPEPTPESGFGLSTEAAGAG